jgi:hypothetical protein
MGPDTVATGADTDATGADTVVTGADAHAVLASRTRMSFVIRRPDDIKKTYEAISGPVEPVPSSVDELSVSLSL